MQIKWLTAPVDDPSSMYENERRKCRVKCGVVFGQSPNFIGCSLRRS